MLLVDAGSLPNAHPTPAHQQTLGISSARSPRLLAFQPIWGGPCSEAAGRVMQLGQIGLGKLVAAAGGARGRLTTACKLVGQRQAEGH